MPLDIDSLNRDVATLLERTLHIQSDLVFVKELVTLQNGRVKKLEEDVLIIKTQRKVLVVAASAVGSILGVVANMVMNYFWGS